MWESNPLAHAPARHQLSAWALDQRYPRWLGLCSLLFRLATDCILNLPNQFSSSLPGFEHQSRDTASQNHPLAFEYQQH